MIYDIYFAEMGHSFTFGSPFGNTLMLILFYFYLSNILNAGLVTEYLLTTFTQVKHLNTSSTIYVCVCVCVCVCVREREREALPW